MKSIPKAKEESARSMGQSSNDAALKGAQIKLKMELECVLDMGRRGTDTNARLMDAQIKLLMDECA